MKKITGVFFVCLSLAACGLSPQTVKIDPELSDSNITPPTKSTTFDLVVSDARPGPVLGQRGGVYKDTAIIKTEGDITGKIQQNLVSIFSKAGYTVDPSAKTRLNITIIKLNYQGHGENRVSEVEVGAEIRATVTKTGGTYTKSYKANRKKEVLKAPDEQKNEALINEILATVIQRVLDEYELLEYITQSQ